MNYQNNNLVITNYLRKSLSRRPDPIQRFFTLFSIILAGAIITLAGVPTIVNDFAVGFGNPVLLSGQSTVASAANNESAATVDPDWWSSTQSELAKYEYHPSENGNGLQAPNRAHNLRTYFDSSGIRVYDRTVTGGPELVGLSLIGLGHGDALQPITAGTLNQNGTRIEIHRPDIIEWYQNSARGLEQGFTLAEQPQGKGPLVLELAVASAQATLLNQSVVLTTEAGRKLSYSGLIAQDAIGRILVSRLEVPSPQRIRLVVEDAGANYPLVIDPLLTGIFDAFLESNQLGSSGIKPSAFGRSVSGAGDVNGDGFADVIVGAWGWDGGENEEGAAFVFLGSAAGIVGTDPSTAHAQIESNQAGARLGFSVSGAGDVNGDGFDDIVVGAYLYRSAVFFEGFGLGTVQGAAFVYLGSATGIQGAGDPALANARIISNEFDSFLGWSVSGAGDVNGDGFADIIVGGPRAGIPFPPNIPPYDRQGDGGVALVFLGSANGITGTGFADAHKELRPYPPGLPQLLGGGMGTSVSGAGDVNGDGFDDIIVGMTGSGGSVIVFLGSASGIVGDDPTTAHTVIASDAVTPLGDSVSRAGDVNGDGFADIIIGAPRFPTPLPGFGPSSGEGAFLVFLGSPVGITATGPSGAQAIFQGNISLQHLGWEVSGAEDIDGDGFDDVIVGALNYAGSLYFEGAAYVFRGSAAGIVGNSPSNDAYVRLESKQSSAALNLVDIALSASGVGDVNGDGFADVILGTGFYDAGELNEGAAFIYHGGPAPVNPNQSPVANAGLDQVVYDIDHDGYATITVADNASFDPDGSIVSYAWLKGETLLGTSAVITMSLPAAGAPGNTSSTGNHPLVLTVTDNNGVTRGDPILVTVKRPDTPFVSFESFSSGNFTEGIGWTGSWSITGDVTLSSSDTFPTPPQVRLGAGASLSRSATLPAGATGMMVTFDAKVSQFSPSDLVTVQVSRDGGPFTAIKTFTVADSDDAYHFYGGNVGNDGRVTLSWYPATAANMVLRFVSTTTTGLFFFDDIEVRALVVPPGQPLPPTIELPVANAGADQVVDDNDTDGFEIVTLDGTLSTDPDGTIVSYQWYEVTSGGTSLLGSGATLGVSFGHGDHTVQLIVTDNDGGSASDTVVVTVNEVFPNNLPPVANAGPDQTIVDVDGNTLEVVTFDGTASTDPDGTIVSYIWRKNGNLLGNTATFGVTQPIGVHTVELTVTDNQGATSTDTVVITVVPNDPIPTIVSFFATPTTITAGGLANLVWTTTGAVTVAIDNGVGTVGLTGSFGVTLTTTTTYTLTATGTGGTATASVTVTVNPAPPPSNQAPTANAGADQTVVDSDGNGTEDVTLDGSASTDPDGTIVSFEWREGATLLAAGVNPLVSLAVGSHTIDLTVTDDAGASANDTMIITVAASATTVSLAFDGFESGDFAGGTGNWLGEWSTGGDVRIRSNKDGPHAGSNHVRLRNSDAFLRRTVDLLGASGVHLTYWGKANQFLGSDEVLVKVSVDGGPFITVETITSADSNNTYQFHDIDLSAFSMTSNVRIEFDSNMNDGRFFIDDVDITGSAGPAPNQAPIANAGPNQSADDGDGDTLEFFTLDGSASSDPDGTIVSYEWREGATLLGTGPTLPGVSFGLGSHTVTLTVTDNGGEPSSDTTIITVNPNQAPVAVAGPDQTAGDLDGNGVEMVTLTGSGSSDADGTIVSFEWREGTTLLATGVNPLVSLAVGLHTIELTVTDDGGATAIDTVIVTVDPQQPPSNQAPTANAGPDQTVVDSDGNGTEGVTLDGSASTDADGTIASYAWREGGTLLATGVNPLSSLDVGSHTIELTVTDNNGATATDTVIVTVDPPPPPTSASLSMTAPASVNRGDDVSITLTINNTGQSTLTNVELAIDWSPAARLKNLSTANRVSIADVPPGGSVSFTWTARADKEGNATLTGEAFSNSVSLGMVAQVLTVVK